MSTGGFPWQWLVLWFLFGFVRSYFLWGVRFFLVGFVFVGITHTHNPTCFLGFFVCLFVCFLVFFLTLGVLEVGGWRKPARPNVTQYAYKKACSNSSAVCSPCENITWPMKDTNRQYFMSFLTLRDGFYEDFHPLGHTCKFNLVVSFSFYKLLINWSLSI